MHVSDPQAEIRTQLRIGLKLTQKVDEIEDKTLDRRGRKERKRLCDLLNYRKEKLDNHPPDLRKPEEGAFLSFTPICTPFYENEDLELSFLCVILYITVI